MPNVDTSKYSLEQKLNDNLLRLKAEIDLLEKNKKKLLDELERLNEDSVSRKEQIEEATKRTDLKTEVDLLEVTIRKRLKEVEKLNENVSLTKKRVSKEIDVLKKEEKRLLKRVKELGNIYFSLKESQEKGKKDYQSFEQERMAVLTGLAKALETQIKEKTKRLLKKAEKLVDKEAFLIELENYLVKLGEIYFQGSAENALEARKLEKMTKHTTLLEKRAKERFDEAEELKVSTQNRFNEIDNKYKEVDKISRFFEMAAIEERRQLKVWSTTILTREKTIEAREKELKREKERQRKKKIQLDDKEKTLQRVYKEIKAKANKADIML